MKNNLKKVIQFFNRPNSSATRISQSMLAFSLSQLINFFVRIGLPPLFLHAWGIHLYGDWLILYSVVAYLSLSNLGGQTYIVNRLSQLFSQDKMHEYQQAFNSGLLLFLILTSTVFVIFTLIIYTLPITHFLNIQHLNASTVKLVLCILAAEILLSLPQGLLTGVYQSIGKLPLGVMIINGMTLLQLSACALGLYLKAQPTTIAFLHMLPLLAVLAFTLMHLPTQLPFRLFALHTARTKMLRSFLVPSFHFLAIDLSSALSIQGIIIILGSLLGSVQVVMFSTLRTLINMMKQILGILSNSAWREMTHYDAIQHQKKLRLLFQSILRSSMVASLIIATLLHFFAKPLYDAWLHQRVPFDPALMNLFLLYGIEMVFWTACANLLMSINRHHTLSRVYLISAILSVIAAYFVGRLSGLQGVVLALLAIDLLFPAWFIPYLVYRYDSALNLHFFIKELLPILLSLLLIALFPLTAIGLIPCLLYWWYNGLSTARDSIQQLL